MSRMGKRPVVIPAGVTVAISDDRVRVKGPKGELSHPVMVGTTVVVEGNEVRVDAERKTRNPAFGTMRAHVANMVEGVTGGFSKTLEIVGTGYRAAPGEAGCSRWPDTSSSTNGAGPVAAPRC